MARKLRKLLITGAALFIIFTVIILHVKEPAGNDLVDFKEKYVEVVDENSIFEDIGRAIPNIPKNYLETQTATKNYNNSCAKYPKLVDLHYNNLYWQTAYVNDSTLHILGAYLDNRVGATPSGSVRILAVIDNIQYSTVNAYCQIWFEDSKAPVIVKTLYNLIWFKAWGSVEKGKILFILILYCCSVF